MCDLSIDDKCDERSGQSDMNVVPPSTHQFLPRSGSVTSSERHFRPHVPNYAQYSSGSGINSATTSYTSCEEPQDWTTTPNHGPTRPPRDDGLLEYIDWKYHPSKHGIPEELEVDDANAGQPPSSSVMATPSVLRPMLGLPNSIDPMLFAPQSPKDALHELTTTVNEILNNACTPDQVSKGIKGLDTLKSLLDSESMPPPPSNTTMSSGERRDGKPIIYKCVLCRKPGFTTFGSCKRHMLGHKIQEFGYRCPRCPRSFRRRDRIKDHSQSHGLRMTGAELDQAQYPLNAPSHCPICRCGVPTWKDLWEHIKSHTFIPRGSDGHSITIDSNRRDSDASGNGGNAHDPSDGSSAAGPSSSHGPSHSHSGVYPHAGPYFGDPYWSQKAPWPPHTTLGEHSTVGPFQRDNPVPETAFSASVDPRGPLPGVAPQQPNESQPFQNPGPIQAPDHSSKRKRTSKDKQPMDQSQPISRKCMRCDHERANCVKCSRLTDPSRGCHKCSEDSTGGTMAQAPSAMSGHAPQGQASTVIELDQSFYGLDSLAAFGQDYDLQMMPVPFDLGMQINGAQTQLESFPSETNSFDSNLQFSNPFVGVATVVQESASLGNLSSKVQEPSFFASDSKLLQSIGQDLFINPLTKVQHEGAILKAPVGPLSTSLVDNAPRNREIPAACKNPKPVSQCSCPCVSRPSLKYQAHTEARLSSLERVQMSFKMSSESPQTTQSLRTQVQVVVRLFRLRAKVAETRSKKTKRRLSTQPGTASDDGYEASSDTDSDSTHDGSPQLAAGSDTASLIQWGEEMQEWSFSVDVGWIIGKLSLWASGMDANMCSEMFYSDPGWILDFVSLYIMHRFMSSPRFTRKF